MNTPDIAIITTCMGRLEHLKCSLPAFLAQDCPDFRVYVVDWSSPDGLGAWLAKEKPENTVPVRVAGKQHFNLSAARNAGGRQACRDGARLLAFIDADILLPSDFLTRNRARAGKAYAEHGDRWFFQTRHLMVNGEEDSSIWGSCMVPAPTWAKHEYNERISSYGMEDNELYSLWVESGVVHLPLSVEGIRSIPHTNEDRMRFYPDGPDDIERLKRENKVFFRSVSKDLF